MTVRPCLPKDAPDPERRRRELEKRRARYSYAPPEDNPLAPIAVAGTYPFGENYSVAWALPYLPHFVRAFADTQVKKLWFGLRDKLGTIDKMEAFAGMFSELLELPPPEQLADWRTDGAFARRWLDGPNPLALSRVRDLDALVAAVPLDDADLRRALGGTRSLADEVAEGRLFVVDYRLVQRSLVPPGPPQRDSRWRDKYLPAPIVVLCERPGVEPLCALVPVAIRIDQPDADSPNPVYVRDNSHAWRLAKLYVDVADFNLQAMSSHIFRHHYMAEPFAVTTPRQLAKDHPVHVLLEPHLRHTIAVNHAAWGLLKSPGSVFDVIYAGELVETRAIMIRSYETWSVADVALDADLRTRGVETGPADYPWRDDARLWRPVIDRYVDGYLRLYYRSDEDVARDEELQAWVAELGAEGGGQLRGMPARLETIDALKDLLAQFLFTAGPGHAAVHYPQTDYFTYVPMYPGAAYKPPPKPDEPITEARILETLPPIGPGADQFQNNQIAYYRFDRFGDYDSYALGRVAEAQPVIARLRDDLGRIEEAITARNRTRPRPYRYMLPSLVPNSINV